MIRLFLGLPVTPIQTELKHLQAKWKVLVPHGARWTPPENLHITLHFLGSTDRALLQPLSLALKKATFPGFMVDVDKVVMFPKPQTARIVGVGFTEPSQVRALYDHLSEALKAFPFQKEDRAYIPHATLVRIEKPVALNASEWKLSPLPLKVESFCLYQSELKPSGAQYQILQEFPLAR